MKRLKKLAGLLIAGLLFIPTQLGAWSEKITHPDLSEIAIRKSIIGTEDYLKNIGFSKGADEKVNGKEVFKWIRDGAEFEDKSDWGFPLLGTTRSVNHFHNPLKPWSQAGLDDWFVFHYTGESSLLWAQDGAKQQNYVEGDWSWQKIRSYYYLALTSMTDAERQANFAKTFRGLGHQMHLIQDAAQPDHVRNDAHPEDTMGLSYGIGIEKWAKKEFPLINSFASNPIFPQLSFDTSYSGLVPITQLFDAEQYDGSNPSASLAQGIAEYTNTNFFSDDTIFAAEVYDVGHRHYFPYPKKSSTDLDDYLAWNKLPETVMGEDNIPDTAFWIEKIADGETIEHFLKPTYLTNNVKDSVGIDMLYYRTFYRDEKCHEDYSKLLIPRAVGYSAGILEYFFRGQLNFQFSGMSTDGRIEIAITNLSDEPLVQGKFEFYYDDKDGNRVQVEELNPSEVTNLSKDSPPFKTTFKPPNNFDPKKKDYYMLVYNGKLGMEEKAYIGKYKQIQKIIPVMVTYHKEENKIFFKTPKEEDNFYIDCNGILNVNRVRIFSVAEQKATMGVLVYDESDGVEDSKVFKFKVTGKDPTTDDRYPFENQRYTKYLFIHSFESIKNRLTYYRKNGGGDITPPVFEAVLGHPERPGPVSYLEFSDYAQYCDFGDYGCSWGWYVTAHTDTVSIPVNGDFTFSGSAEGYANCGFVTWAGYQTVGPIIIPYSYEERQESEILYNQAGSKEKDEEVSDVEFINLTVWLTDPNQETLENLKYSLLGSIPINYELGYRTISYGKRTLLGGAGECGDHLNNIGFYEQSYTGDPILLGYNIPLEIRNDGDKWTNPFDIFDIKRIVVEHTLGSPYRIVFADVGTETGWGNYPGTTNTWYIKLFETPLASSDGWGILNENGTNLGGHNISYINSYGGTQKKYVWQKTDDKGKRQSFTSNYVGAYHLTYNKGGGTLLRSMGKTGYENYGQESFYFIGDQFFGGTSEIPEDQMNSTIYPFGKVAKELLTAKRFWALDHVPVCDSNSWIYYDPVWDDLEITVNLSGKFSEDTLSGNSIITKYDAPRLADFGVIDAKSISQWLADINPSGQTNIPTNVPITTLFTSPVDQATINSDSFSVIETANGSQVAGTFSFDIDDRLLIFKPQTDLKPYTTYTISLTGDIKDIYGIPLDYAYKASFTTGGSSDAVSPRVVVIPEDQSNGIPSNTVISFIFGESMNPATINSFTIMVTNNGTPVSGNIILGHQNSVATFVPISAFLPNSLIQVTLSHRITDIAGNPIVGSGGIGTDFISSFNTANTVDILPPKVINISPLDGVGGIDVYSSVSVMFNEPINPVTVNGETFIVSENATRYWGWISFSEDNTVMTLTPDQPFLHLSLITVNLTAGIKDLAGNAMAIPFTSNFITGGEAELTLKYFGETILNSGDAISINVGNPGDVATEFIYSVNLKNTVEEVVYQYTGSDLIQGGTFKNYSFQIPPQASDNDYDLYAEVIDSRGRKTSLTVALKIIGLEATLHIRSDKDIYLEAEPITAISNVLTGPVEIEGGSLKVAVVKRESVTGQFSHFLPKKGWAPISDPFTLAMGHDGSMYVSQGSSYIQKFDSKGKFITMWGGYGSVDGKFNVLTGIAVGPDGSVYVADRGNYRIQKFDTNGNFMMKWGSFGTDNGEFVSLEGIATGPDGSVYVVDSPWYIQKFDSNGNFITKWGTKGSGDGQLNSPSGIAIGPDGSVYVVDTGNNRIQKFDTNGNFLTKWGSQGGGNGQFSSPSSITINSTGLVYVADGGNYRVQEFDANGSFVTKWGNRGAENGQFITLKSISIGPNSTVFVADSENDRIQEFDSFGNFIKKWGMIGKEDGEFYSLSGIAVGPDGSIYTIDRTNCRYQKCVQKFDKNGNFVANLGSYGTGYGQLSEPLGITVGPDGSVYVGDWRGVIEKFDGNGDFIAEFGKRGSGDGEIDIPTDIAIGPDGSVYIADPYNHRIDKFDSQGNFVTKWGQECESDYDGDGMPERPCYGGFLAPEGIDIGLDGSVYVADQQNRCIQKFDSSGNFIAKWGGTKGNGDGQFNQPVGVTIGPDGSVYVSDVANNRIQKFDENGNFITKWGSYGIGDGQFYYPFGIALGSDGSIYVAERNNRIQRMLPITETLFENTLPINQPPNTNQEYLTNIGILNSAGKFHLQATLLNNIGQIIAQSEYPFSKGSPEQIISVSPVMGMTNVPTNTLVTVLFYQPIDRMTVNSTSFSLVETSTGAQISGHFSFDFDDTLVIFTTNTYLESNANYALNITRDIRNADGIPLDQSFTSSFSTAGFTDTVSPTVTVSPEDGSTEIPINALVVFSFSEPINPITVNSSTIVVTNNGMPVNGNITLDPQKRMVTFTPASSFLPDSSVNLILSYRITDMTGNPIVGSGGVGTDFISSFTTGSTTDIDPPQVLSVTPADGETDVDRNIMVSVSFNEPINPVTVNSETFTISVGGVKQSGGISFSGQNTIVTFTADQPFPPLSLVIVTLLPGISDVSGNVFNSIFTSSFTTQGEPRLTIGYSGPTTLTLGDTINVEVTNAGDLDTSSIYTVKLSDKNEVVIYQNTIIDTIQVGASKIYGFQIPNQAADNDYTLYAEVIDSRDIKTTTFFNIKIIGLNATLTTSTDKEVYSPTESITGISTILNGPFGIEDGSLKVSVSKISHTAAGQFTQFLPQKVWWYLNYPSEVAVGPDGSVYVTDTENHRIQKYDGNGNFITNWGIEGSEDGQFEYPYGIAMGPDGSVYVVDSGNDRIQKFDSNGNFITKWGTQCITDPNGDGIPEQSCDGQFYGPESIAMGPDGSVYITDCANHRIQKFGSDGNFITKWGSLCNTDPNGDGVPEQPCDGQFYYPRGIAMVPDGSVYVTDDNHRIQKFDSNGNFITKWGSYCETDPNWDGIPEQPCDGQFDWPVGIAVAPDGSVYVTDWNNQIQKFDTNGNFITKWGSYCEADSDWDGIPDQPCDGQFAWPYGIAVSPEGSVYVTDSSNHRIEKFDSNGNFIMKWGSKSPGTGDGEFRLPKGVAVGPDSSIFVADTENRRIQKFDSSGNFINKWYEIYIEVVCHPGGIAVGQDGSVYVAHPDFHIIMKFDSSGNFITYWGTEGSGDGQFIWDADSLIGIAVGPDGMVYVTDSGNHRIQKFDSNGNFITQWGSYCEADPNWDGIPEQPCDGQFYYPRGIAMGPDGSVYVTDDNNRIQKFDNNGNFIAKWGNYCNPDSDWDGIPDQPCDGQFNGLSGIAIGPDGFVYVADTWNNRIQKFDRSGNFLAKWGSSGGGNGQFYNPMGIAVAPDGSVYVADRDNNRIQRMTPEHVTEAIFETIINQAASTTQDYTTNIGTLDATGKLYFEATFINNLGQTITQSSYPFYIIEGNTVLVFSTDKKVYNPGETVMISGRVENRGGTDLVGLVLSFNTKYPNQSSQTIYNETFDLPAGGSHPFTVTTSSGGEGTVRLTGSVNQNSTVLIEIQDYYEVTKP